MYAGGGYPKALNIPVKPTFTVGKVKEDIGAQHGWEVNKQRLIFKGTVLGDDACTLGGYGINASSPALTLEIDDDANPELENKPAAAATAAVPFPSVAVAVAPGGARPASFPLKIKCIGITNLYYNVKSL